MFTDISYNAVSTFGIYGNLPHCIAIKPFMSSWHISCYLFFLFVACHKNIATIEAFFMQIQSTSKYIWHQKLQQCAELSFLSAIFTYTEFLQHHLKTFKCNVEWVDKLPSSRFYNAKLAYPPLHVSSYIFHFEREVKNIRQQCGSV